MINPFIYHKREILITIIGIAIGFIVWNLIFYIIDLIY